MNLQTSATNREPVRHSKKNWTEPLAVPAVCLTIQTVGSMEEVEPAEDEEDFQFFDTNLTHIFVLQSPFSGTISRAQLFVPEE